jgi:hypothetical protein
MLTIIFQSTSLGQGFLTLGLTADENAILMHPNHRHAKSTVHVVLESFRFDATWNYFKLFWMPPGVPKARSFILDPNFTRQSPRLTFFDHARPNRIRDKTF